MKKSIQILSLIILIIFVSGCASFSNLGTPQKAKTDNTLEVVNSNSLKALSDLTSVALEWRKVSDGRIVGYNIYRSNFIKNGQKLHFLHYVPNRYSAHYVDTKLTPNTKYLYVISSVSRKDFQSKFTKAIAVTTTAPLVPVNFVQALSNLPREIKILWRPYPNPSIKYYLIQRKNPSKAGWDNLETIQNRLSVEYIDQGLDDNAVYMYRVIAYTFNDTPSLPSEIVKAQTKPLPQGVNNLRATNNQARKITLTWDPSNTSDVVKYKIYSSDDADGSFSPVATVPSSQLKYTNPINLNGKVVFYKITSIDKDELETSLNMNSVMGHTLPRPAKPIVTLAQIQGQKAILNWKAGDKRTVSYIVHKVIQVNMFNTKTLNYRNVKGNRFVDKDIIRGVKYKYTLQAVDAFGILSANTAPTSLILPTLKNK